MGTTVGVRVAYLEAFIEQNGGRTKLAETTTTDVKSYIVKIQTAAAQESYVQRLQRQYATTPEMGEHTGPATLFVIHSWMGRFVDTVDSIVSWCDETKTSTKDVFVWMDLFCFNQHSREEKPAEWFMTSLCRQIDETNHVLLVLSPWDNCSCLNRAWCLYEIYTADRLNTRFEVIMTPSEYSRFLLDVQKSPTPFFKMLSNIKSKYAVSTKMEDRNAIFAAIKAQLGASGGDGLAEFDKCVSSVLEKWLLRRLRQLVNTAREAAAAEGGMEMAIGSSFVSRASFINSSPSVGPTLTAAATAAATAAGDDEQEDVGEGGEDEKLSSAEEEHAKRLDAAVWMRALAQLYEVQGMLSSSLPLREAVLAAFRAAYGEFDERSLAASGNLAQLYKLQGSYSMAQPLLEVSLEAMKATLGVDHPSTLQGMHELAGICECQEMLEETEVLLVECFARRKRVLGEDHRDTLVSMNSLAQLSATLGRWHDAISLYNDCIIRRRKTLGEEHEETLQSLMSLASLYNDLGKYDQALSLLKRVLGDNSLETLRCMKNLSASLSAQGKFADAAPLLEEVVKKFKDQLGDCEETVEAVGALATVYDDLRDFDQALPLLIEYLAACQRVHGDDDPQTLQCMESLANLYKNLGELDKAIEMLQQCIDKSEKSTDDGIIYATSLRNRLAVLLADAGQVEKAAELVKQCLKEREARLGPDHSDTISSMSQLANLLVVQGELELALETHAECYTRRLAILGIEHAHTKHSKRECLELRKRLHLL